VNFPLFVIPANAGTQGGKRYAIWVPALWLRHVFDSAGMTNKAKGT